MKNINLPVKELDFQFSRSSGAGGQNVNKVNSKVTLRWNLRKSKSLTNAIKKRFEESYPRKISEEGVVQITSQRFRTQARNIADCVEKLHSMLEDVRQAPKYRVKTKPTRGSVEKRIKSKKNKSDTKKNRKKPEY